LQCTDMESKMASG